MRILLVEDEALLRRQLRAALIEAGYAVDEADNGVDAQHLGATEPYDAVVLDLGLPRLDGLTVLQRWRGAGRTMPVLILTARDSWHEKVTGIDTGADDYLAKPFSPKELLARMRAVLRRKAPQAADEALQVGPLRLEPATHRVFCVREGEAEAAIELRLGPTEFRLLRFFMAHAQRVHTRAQLLDRVWGDHVFIEERTVDVHIKRLREALAAADCAALVETVRGVGYRLVDGSAGG